MKVEFPPPAPREDRPTTGRLITASISIIADSREQLPYDLPGATRGTLSTGDYSIEGYEDKVAIERKTLADFLGCVGRGRDRFQRELERLSSYACPAIVIEATLEDILRHRENEDIFSNVHPHAAVNSLIAWSVRYRIPVWLAGDRASGEALTFRILQHFARIQAEREDIE